MRPPAPNDADLVRRAQEGDRAALERLLVRHHDDIRLLCVRLCRHAADADDATQEALLAVVRGLPRFDHRSSFRTWVYRVATNACLDELRRRRRRPDPVDPDRVPEVVSPSEGPDDHAVRSEQRVALLAGLADLPEEFRVAVVLRDVMDLDYGQIAEVLGVPVGTVRSRLSRGRSRLAQDLGPTGPGNRTARSDVQPPVGAEAPTERPT